MPNPETRPSLTTDLIDRYVKKSSGRNLAGIPSKGRPHHYTDVEMVGRRVPDVKLKSKPKGNPKPAVSVVSIPVLPGSKTLTVWDNNQQIMDTDQQIMDQDYYF